jgi:hypothetical protein
MGVFPLKNNIQYVVVTRLTLTIFCTILYSAVERTANFFTKQIQYIVFRVLTGHKIYVKLISKRWVKIKSIIYSNNFRN